MATNKESLIVILDIRTCAQEEFKLKAVKCVAEIIKDKIVSDKKDYISFVLVGAETHEKDAPNVKKYETIQLCTWPLLLKFFKFVNETATEKGQWLDGLKVALEMQEEAMAFKPARQRILLLFDFNSAKQEYEPFQGITNNLLNSGIELIVGSHNIAYKDNPETNMPQAIFNLSRKATPEELENQKHALQLVFQCNATLCNFKETLRNIFKVTNRRPWCWNAKLFIGSKITLNLQGIIAMKNESLVKLKKVWSEKKEWVSREERYYIKGAEITPLPEDLIDGYMLGGTAVPYDDTLIEPKEPHPAGLHFVGFVEWESIPNEYFCGDSLYMLVHQKGNSVSARKLDALVRALILKKRVILCWKIFSLKFNTPRVVVLIPQQPEENKPASLYMLELSYHAQHHFWDFPSLRTPKTESNSEQLQAIDNLIDSMDLEYTLKDTQMPRACAQNDLLPFDGLPSIYEQNIMDILEYKVLKRVSNDEQFKKLKEERKFVDVFWSVPEAIEEKSKQAANAVKKLFPLERSLAWQEKLKAKELEEQSLPVKQERKDQESPLHFDNVGLVNPAQDYKQILENLKTLSNTTLRDSQFQVHSAQMRVVILTLMERRNLNLKQLTEVIQLYRKSCLDFNSLKEYDQFASELKKKATDNQLKEFWEKIIVELQLGPLLIGEPTLDDELRLKGFYTIEQWPDAMEE
ncbi:LOW QUALITY PROTEIN: uncharacterized protein Ku80 [Drosophila tropicalis]|uniref:LOW QUALITY PROTEIN: uncharacterized protein Ku80 n=1 Tax=Drosophila tropicalis TaxID=46794 RepID=UPI0035AC1D48